jgi:2-isopropylmalate synthase
MRAEDVGWSANKIVLGKLSGRNAFKGRVHELGIPVESESEMNAAFARFKELADRKAEIFDEDIQALFSDETVTPHDEHFKLVSMSQHSETGERPHAAIVMTVGHVEMRSEADGNGPVDAIFKAIRTLVPHEATLELYQVHAVTGGTDAQAEVSVRLSESGRSFTAKGADPDTLVASAKAYLGALNKLTSKRNKTASVEGRIHSTDVG